MGSAGFKAWQEPTLREIPKCPEVGIFGIFLLYEYMVGFVLSLLFKVEVLSSFGVLVGLLLSVSPWSIRSTSGVCCLPLCCVAVGGCWKHLCAALGDGLDEH